ncbi:hypothetical protein MUK70_08450 [Dyadobacter chenwenxiniae]|uniref:Uncharacterized protein n=1 Tax=Dyadobacter chenwenxiniae TaxID=2906456 RepID=A0A9X1PQ62_9BACT|nr:hypothetical protein [Dyadobacter chenwenxiniae]MCF0062811.1 hypothetical protein [Dyadobacter chenwenxiniae]UON85014.1 hypothetical protein MUK70_08450 [Dyadobacter chenwenxiniae]
MADGFRNYRQTGLSISTEKLWIDKSQLLKLTAPELIVLVRGRRALSANFDGSKYGVFTSSAGQLINDFLLNLPRGAHFFIRRR